MSKEKFFYIHWLTAKVPRFAPPEAVQGGTPKKGGPPRRGVGPAHPSGCGGSPHPRGGGQKHHFWHLFPRQFAVLCKRKPPFFWKNVKNTCFVKNPLFSKFALFSLFRVSGSHPAGTSPLPFCWFFHRFLRMTPFFMRGNVKKWWTSEYWRRFGPHKFHPRSLFDTSTYTEKCSSFDQKLWVVDYWGLYMK